MAARKRWRVEQIIGQLREAEAEYTERPFGTRREETGQRPITDTGSAQLSIRG